MKRVCVFCGNTPEDKNKEHVLPQWLLSMTGDPKRVVNFGTNYRTGKTIRFDWSSLVVPSCTSCNSDYAKLEERAKQYVKRLLDREGLTSIEYIDFLDWMDKVRISVWLAYHRLQGNPTSISPSFHVNQRSSLKERMIAIYSIGNNEKGLNTFGSETFVFHSQPSCIGLKINNIFIINISSDYLFSGRCGFPQPKKFELILDGENQGKSVASGFSINRRVMHPLIRKNIIKPSIHLYQPMMQPDSSGTFNSGFVGDYSNFDSYLAQHTLAPYPSGKGILFRQHLDRVEPIYDLEKTLEFQNVSGFHSRPMHELIAQVYTFQKFLFERTEYTANNQELVKAMYQKKKAILKHQSSYINHYRGMQRVTNAS